MLLRRRRAAATAFSFRTALPLLVSLTLACSEDVASSGGGGGGDDDDETTDDSASSDSSEDSASGRGENDDAAPSRGGKQDGAVRPTDGGRPLDGSTRLSDAGTGRDTGAGTPSDAGVERPADSGEMPADTGTPTPPSFAGRTIVPHASWTCGMPEGIPSPVGAPVVFTAEWAITNIREVGTTQFGKRQLIELGSGAVDGPKIKATLQKGGLDQPMVLSNGALELEEILTLKTSDNRNIYLRVCGTAPNDTEPTRIVMDFEAPNSGPYGFLNTTKLVGTREVDVAGKKIKLSVHDVTAATVSSDKVTIENPAGVVDQTWDCKEDTGTAGKEIYKEVVNIGSSASVGASKRGNRNIIPITGGTCTGRVKGSVLPGGGDFQLLDNGFMLDARYTMLSDDKELILVRNCGPASALIPVFEARADGPYAYLNENNWVSSSPSIGLGTVTLTISEKR